MANTDLKHILIGNRVVLTAPFLNDNDDPANPTTVTFEVQIDDGLVVDYVFGTDAEVTNPTVGTFVCKLDVDVAGTWKVAVAGEGAIHARSEKAFEAVPSVIGA